MVTGVSALRGWLNRIFCFFGTDRMNDGVELSTGLIGRLAALELPVAIDIYNSNL
jgi:hypothetical protein